MSIEINGAGTITGVDSLSTPAVTNAAGSASAPTITFTGDINTGLYSPGADQVAVTTGGTARLFVDASGRLLVGTSTSRGGWFNTSGQDSLIQTETTTQNVFSGVQNSNSALGPWILLGKSRGTTAGAVTVVQNDDPLGGITFQGADGTEMVDGCRIQAFVDGTPGANDLPTRLVFSTTADGASSPTERMRVTSAGLVGIGTASPTVRLETVGSASILGATNVCARFSDNTNSTFAIGHPTGGGVDLIGNAGLNFCTSDGTTKSERARIDSSGRLLVGTSTTAYAALIHAKGSLSDYLLALENTNAGPYGIRIRYSAASPNGASNDFLYCDDSTALRFQVRSNGGLANYSANNVNLSDRNAKKDIALASDTWNCLKKWEIVNFRYKDQPDDSDLNMGVIAQQIAESCPEVITVFQEATEDQPEKLGVKDQQMMWMAIKALQEAQLRIETLEAEVAALKAQ